MVGKAGDIIIRIVTAKVIEHQEWIQALLQILREYAREFDSGTVAGWHPGYDAFYRPRLRDGFKFGCLFHGYTPFLFDAWPAGWFSTDVLAPNFIKAGSPRRIHGAEKFVIGLCPGKPFSRRKDKVWHATDASLKSVSGHTVNFRPVTSCMQNFEYFVASHPQFFPYLGKHFWITNIPRLREVSPEGRPMIGIAQTFSFRKQTDFVGLMGIWHKSGTVERKISRSCYLTDGSFSAFQYFRWQDRTQWNAARRNIGAQQVGVPMQANRTLFCQPGQPIQADVTPWANKVRVNLNGRGH
jgi:hypothetical protein